VYTFFGILCVCVCVCVCIHCVPLTTEPGISLIILTPMKILQRNLNRSTFVVWEMKRNMCLQCVCSRCNILISYFLTYSLSWANPIQSIYPHSTSWRPIVILSIHLRLGLPSGLFPSGFSTKTLYTPSPNPYAIPSLVGKLLMKCRVADWSLQHGYHSNPTTPKLRHTSNQEQYDQCGNSTE